MNYMVLLSDNLTSECESHVSHSQYLLVQLALSDTVLVKKSVKIDYMWGWTCKKHANKAGMKTQDNPTTETWW